MSARRSIQRVPLAPLVRNSLQAQTCSAIRSPICIRHLQTSPRTVARNIPSRIYLHRQARQQRSYATIVHNQKYNEDKLPLTLEITPSCVKVGFPRVMLMIATEEDSYAGEESQPHASNNCRIRRMSWVSISNVSVRII
jgi:hypothetical protein